MPNPRGLKPTRLFAARQPYLVRYAPTTYDPVEGHAIVADPTVTEIELTAYAVKPGEWEDTSTYGIRLSDFRTILTRARLRPSSSDTQQVDETDTAEPTKGDQVLLDGRLWNTMEVMATGAPWYNYRCLLQIAPADDIPAITLP